jgi:hypothetical protein
LGKSLIELAAQLSEDLVHGQIVVEPSARPYKPIVTCEALGFERWIDEVTTQ